MADLRSTDGYEGEEKTPIWLYPGEVMLFEDEFKVATGAILVQNMDAGTVRWTKDGFNWNEIGKPLRSAT